MSRRERGLLAYWVLGWILFSNLFVVYRFVGLNWAEEVLRFTAREWAVLFAQASFIGALAGTWFGAVDLYARRHSGLRRLAFGTLVALKSVAYSVLTMVVILLAFFLAALANGMTVAAAGRRVVRFGTSSYALVILLYFFVNATLLTFIEQVSEKYGASRLIRVFLGRYHHPVQEDRVFVFLDLRSSTTYAERLGHILYSRLIQDFFRDITDFVETYEAEIYQYVGDEIVLSWRLSDDAAACRKAVLLCYEFKRGLGERAAHYESSYGFVPEFKVGMSGGPVTVAEVGISKKEIAYHGDVLNTAARIQEQCTTYGKFLLCSEAVARMLRPHQDLRVEAIGDVTLKGKARPVAVCSVEPAGGFG